MSPPPVPAVRPCKSLRAQDDSGSLPLRSWDPPYQKSFGISNYLEPEDGKCHGRKTRDQMHRPWVRTIWKVSPLTSNLSPNLVVGVYQNVPSQMTSGSPRPISSPPAPHAGNEGFKILRPLL